MLTLRILVPLALVVADAASAQAQPVPAQSVLIRLIDDVEVPSKTAGVLSQLAVVEGQYVREGARLAQIDNTEALLIQRRAAIELKIAEHKATNDLPRRSATKKLAFSRSDFQRLERADREMPRSVSQTQLEEAQLQADQAALELQQAERELQEAKLAKQLKENELQLSERNVEIREILAPLSGIVVEVTRKTGEWVEAGDQVLRIVRMDRLRAEGFVAAEDALRLTPGAAATVKVVMPGQSAAEFSGHIVLVSPEINPVNGQVRVWAEVDNPQGILRPGLRASMSIIPKRAAADRRQLASPGGKRTPHEPRPVVNPSPPLGQQP